ncbi:MAG: glutamine--fructose-6-phosphate transaminase (isomerizing) [Thaumarchaeota archaeon]|nr:glutamine--fructose-6-phosphate transaminase (isomerizing) [Nitrososphaerota archaeon]
MCGIIGYTGNKDAAPVLLQSLKKMEYRGYDSAGFGIIHDKSIQILKDAGRIDDIASRVSIRTKKGTTGIAHTRWATHGGVTQTNAHPHVSCDTKIAVVHNGIIENYQELSSKLKNEGHRFASETDTEVIAHLIEKYYRIEKSPLKALQSAVKQLKGTFATLALFDDKPELVLGARKDAPLVVGLGKGENFIASDIVSFISYTDKVAFLKDYEIASITPSKVQIFTFDGEPVPVVSTQVAWEASDISKKEFAHYTLKEISEQANTINAALDQDEVKIVEFCEAIRNAENVRITASGTSFHAGILMRYLLAKLAKIHAQVFISSEIDHEIDLIDENTLVIAISQSGETADVLEAVKKAAAKGAKIVSLVNTVGSSLTRESKVSLPLNCGPEIGVAATKSFTSQLAIIYDIAFRLAGLDDKREQLNDLGRYVEIVLNQGERIKEIAEKHKLAADFYFIGRGLHFPIALEGALKMKELSYTHAEGLAAGELKHGTLALVDAGTPVIAINPSDETYSETLSNISEMKARGARVIAVSDKDNELYDEIISIPSVDPAFFPIIEVIPLQILAYYAAVERALDPDYPRHLAKSVTVK